MSLIHSGVGRLEELPRWFWHAPQLRTFGCNSLKMGIPETSTVPWARLCTQQAFNTCLLNLPANAGDTGLIPGSGRSHVEGKDNSLQYSCLGNPHGLRSLAGYSPQDRRVGHDIATKQQYSPHLELREFIQHFPWSSCSSFNDLFAPGQPVLKEFDLTGEEWGSSF